MSQRILVVEDETTIAFMIEEMLIDLGHEVVGLAMGLPQAMEMAEAEQLDLALLDVNLEGNASYPVADLLESRGIPVIFASGYGSVGLDPAYRDRVTLTKPFFLNDLRGAIEQALLQGVTAH